MAADDPVAVPVDARTPETTTARPTAIAAGHPESLSTP